MSANKHVRIYRAIQPDGTALWPDIRPIEWLLDKQANMPGPYFNAQYMNDPSGLRGVRYDISWLQFVWEQQLPPINRLIGVQCGDPATSTEESSNYFGHCTAGRDPFTGFIYILGFAFGHIPATEHLNFLWAQYAYWRDQGLQIHKVLLEEAGPQQGTTQRLAEDTRLSATQQMPLNIVKPKGSKEQRYDSLLPFMRNRTILFPGTIQGGDGSLGLPTSTNPGFDEFQREWTAFPKGGRDDLLDAYFYVCDDFLTTSSAGSVTGETDQVDIGELAKHMSADDLIKQYSLPVEPHLPESSMEDTGRSSAPSNNRLFRTRPQGLFHRRVR